MQLLIDTDETAPPAGRWQIPLRTSKLDKDIIASAADRVGMSTAAFIRSVALQAACRVLEKRTR